MPAKVFLTLEDLETEREDLRRSLAEIDRQERKAIRREQIFRWFSKFVPFTKKPPS